jgi:aconitase A
MADGVSVNGLHDRSVAANLEPGMTVKVTATDASGAKKQFGALLRIDTPDEADYYRHGGILQYVLRSLATA